MKQNELALSTVSLHQPEGTVQDLGIGLVVFESDPDPCEPAGPPRPSPSRA